MKIVSLVVAVLLAATVSAQAQEVSQAEVFAGYSYLRTESSLVRHLHGWDGSVTFNVTKVLGLTAESSGHYGGNTLRAVINQNPVAIPYGSQVHAFHVGSRFAWRNDSRVTPFARGLVGVLRNELRDQSSATLVRDPNGFVFPLPGRREINTSLSFVAGGGFDVKWTDRISLRPAQVDYVSARNDSLTLDHLRVSTGLVFHFGKK